MAKIKLTKTELKAQRDALKRFSRYLPTLQLKKQQLQMETRRVQEQLESVQAEREQFEARVERWIGLLDASHTEQVKDLVKVQQWQITLRNIAGVETPELADLVFEEVELDLFATPVWYDDLAEAQQKLVRYRLLLQVLQEQLEALEVELRTTTQRVNLFEKVKIPEAEENIRRIQIYLGDEQTSAVGRAKIAKRKTKALEAQL
jgi:V/A-type H+-transporting ATPase subunit D